LILLLVAACSALASAQVIVAPNTNDANSDNRWPFFTSGGMRYQQVYDSSQFSALSSPELITQIAFRPSPFLSTAFTTTLADVQIDFSTISAGAGALSTTFANNVGANDTVDYSGALTLSSSDTQGVFDTTITLTTPFLYDPSAGNLLMDVRNIDGATAFIGSEFFAADNTGSVTSRVFGAEGNPNATAGTADNLGLITQFTFQSQQPAGTPEPGSLALLAAGGAVFSVVRRQRKGKVEGRN
jgi:hypothetical protein